MFSYAYIFQFVLIILILSLYFRRPNSLSSQNVAITFVRLSRTDLLGLKKNFFSCGAAAQRGPRPPHSWVF